MGDPLLSKKKKIPPLLPPLKKHTCIFVLLIHFLYAIETACINAICTTFGSMLTNVLMVAPLQAGKLVVVERVQNT